MLSYNEITPKKYIELDGEPYEVLASFVFRKQQRKPVNQTKLRNLKTGSMLEHTFHQNEKVEEADIEKRTVTYLFSKTRAGGNEHWFCKSGDPKERFQLSDEVVGSATKYAKEGSDVEAMVFDDEIIGITLPIKVELVVTEAAPAVKGNTAQGATKTVTLETGLTITTPLFINEGDVVRINTETGEYVERVEKK